MRRIALLAAGACLSGLAAASPSRAVAADGPAASTSVADVRGAGPTASDVDLLAYTATHDVLQTLPPGSGLPLARISRDAYDSADADAWNDAGYVGAWLAPSSGSFEFDPSNDAIDSSYYDNFILPDSDNDSETLQPGDQIQVAMAGVRDDTPMPFDRERGSADGSLQWQVVTDSRTISATYEGATASMDVVMFRADLFAVGGDVDARTAPLATPAVTIPLPHMYSTQAVSQFTMTTFFPVTEYLNIVRPMVEPAAGEAVFNATLQGYLPQAADISEAGGGTLHEWHLMTQGVITISDQASTAGSMAPRLIAGFPSNGVAITGGTGVAPSEHEVAAGQALESGGGVAAMLVSRNHSLSASAGTALSPATAGSGEGTAATPSADGSAPGASLLTQELLAAAPINASLSAPASLIFGKGRFDATIDPDFDGTTLGVVAPRQDGTETFAQAVAIPYAIIDGETVQLDRSRLLDLRVEPTLLGDYFIFEGYQPAPPVFDDQTQKGGVRQDGMDVEAVYDLGGGLLAFIDFSIADRVVEPEYLDAVGFVLAMDGSPHNASLVQYEELPENGPITFDGTTYDNEFTTPFDDNDPSLPYLTIGDHELAYTIADQPVDGQLTVLRAPATLTPTPTPDPTISIVGAPLALFYTTPSGASDPTEALSVAFTILLPGATGSAPPPPPLGQPQCGAPPIVGADSAGIPLDQDIENAFFDSESQTLYASLTLGDVPTQAPPGTVEDWQVHWRYEHSGAFAARAQLDSSGAWTFDTGAYTSSGYIEESTVTGQVRDGANGVIQIAIPYSVLSDDDGLFDYRDGELLRDTSALAGVVISGEYEAVDEAPPGTGAVYGSGGDYVLGCGAMSITATPEAPGQPLLVATALFVCGLFAIRRRRRSPVAPQ